MQCAVKASLARIGWGAANVIYAVYASTDLSPVSAALPYVQASYSTTDMSDVSAYGSK